MSDASFASMVRSRNKKDLDLRFYFYKEHETLSIDDKAALKDWRLSHTDEFGQSKRKVVDARKGGNHQRKR